MLEIMQTYRGDGGQTKKKTEFYLSHIVSHFKHEELPG